MTKNYFKEIVKYDPVNNYICFTKDELQTLKNSITREDILLLKQKLDYILLIDYEKEKRSVIYKSKPIEGININNYVSLATYYWPDETKENKLPYIQKDGYSNPEGELYDKDNLRELAYNTYIMGLLYYLTDEKKYLDHLIHNSKYYFINPLTKMNPNMDNAQMIKGINLGRGIGIIDYAANYSYALVMIKNLYDLGLMDNDFYKDLLSWCEEFLNWLINSNNGLEEKHAKNNHGTMYDFLLIVLYDLLGKKELIKPLVFDFINYRLVTQIDEDGRLPLELNRTKSKSYSLMGFKGFFDFSIISSKYGYNLYNTDDFYYKKIKVSLKSGFTFLYNSLVLKTTKWQYEQVTSFDEACLLPLILFGNKYIKLNNPLNLINKDNVIHDVLYILVKYLV